MGVLDSDLMGLLTLAQELSSRLQTHAICVMVNDSDSWHYELFHKGHEVDGFDSPGASPLLNLDELPEDMLEMPDAGELAEAMEAVMETMPELANLLQSLLPPEMREIHQKITDGTATPEQAEEFTRWSQELAEGAAVEFGDAAKKSDDSDLPVAAADSDGNGQSASKQELKGHLHHLRPLLASGAQPDRVKEVLVEKATFAEEPMADFLEILGVSRVFGQLSFRYLAEFNADEIHKEGIEFQAPPRLRKDQLASSSLTVEISSLKSPMTSDTLQIVPAATENLTEVLSLVFSNHEPQDALNRVRAGHGRIPGGASTRRWGFWSRAEPDSSWELRSFRCYPDDRPHSGLRNLPPGNRRKRRRNCCCTP